MRRLTFLAAAALVALVATGVAVGNHRDRSTSSLSATFTATSVGDRKVSTCTSGDGTFQITNATYSGQATGDSTLTGPIKVAVRAVINTSEKLGTVDARLSVDRSGRDTKAHLVGVYRDGNVSGLLTGFASDPGQRLVGTLTASYSSDGGFSNGAIGSGSVTGAAVRETGGTCKMQATTAGKLKLLGGTVSALSSGSIAISLGGGSSFSCALDDRARRELSRRDVEVGDHVSAACAFRDNAWVLLRARKLR